MNQLPAHLQNRARRDLIGATLGGLNIGSPPHISIAGNRFTLVDDAGNEKPIQTLFLDVCVIDANASVSKIFFDPRTPYEPGGDNSNPPICWSDNGIGASTQASQPQNTSCQLCPQNAWGSSTSKATGKPTKACNDVKKLAVLVPGMEMVFLLRIPPASLKHLAKYTQTLAGHGVDLPDAITRLEFESQGVLKFTPVGYVDEATAALTDKVVAAKATDLLIGRNDRAWTGAADQQKLAYAAQGAGQQLPSPVGLGGTPMPIAPPPQPFGGGQVPAAPFGTAPPAEPFLNPTTPSAFTAGLTGQGAAGQPTSPFAQPGTSSPTDATPASRRGRGPNKPKPQEAPPFGQQASTTMTSPSEDGIPPFLQRNAQPPVPPAPPANTFGMNPNPPAPDAGVQAALDAAFRLPT